MLKRHPKDSATASIKTKNKIWAYLYMPILYILVLLLIFVAVIAPYKSRVLSWIGMFSSPIAYDDTTLSSIYQGYKKPEPEVSQDDNDTSSDEPVELPTEEFVSMRKVEVPYYNTQYAHLSCEDIGVDCPLYFGDSNAAMKKGAGQYMGSYLPGYNGQILVCAHNTTFFRPLEYVKIGQVFTLTTNYGVYQYEVYKTEIHDKNDKTAYYLKERIGEELVLYTCYPFYRMSSVKTDRFFVYCKKISGPRVVNDQGEPV